MARDEALLGSEVESPLVDLDGVALAGDEVRAQFDNRVDEAVEGVAGDVRVVGGDVGDADDEGTAAPAVGFGLVELVAAGGQA